MEKLLILKRLFYFTLMTLFVSFFQLLMAHAFQYVQHCKFYFKVLSWNVKNKSTFKDFQIYFRKFSMNF